jgi:hypothetical protein
MLVSTKNPEIKPMPFVEEFFRPCKEKVPLFSPNVKTRLSMGYNPPDFMIVGYNPPDFMIWDIIYQTF